jgi:hypothetical protein
MYLGTCGLVSFDIVDVVYKNYYEKKDIFSQEPTSRILQRTSPVLKFHSTPYWYHRLKMDGMVGKDGGEC